jgi:hypothetical protein
VEPDSRCPGAFHFEVAKAQFQDLLRKCNYPQTIVWLTPEDALLTDKPLVYVRFPVSADNELKVRQIFDEGVARGRGVLISTVCEMADSTCCFVCFPEDGEEGHYGLWPKDGGVKMTAKMEWRGFQDEPSEIHCGGLCWDCDIEQTRANGMLYFADVSHQRIGTEVLSGQAACWIARFRFPR